MIGDLGQTGVYIPVVQSTYWPHVFSHTVNAVP
jgi:hypothetical protein